MFILIIVVLGAVLADSETLIITLKIEAAPPTFQLYGSLDNVTASADMDKVGEELTEGATLSENATIRSTDTILSSPVYVYCAIKQDNASKFAGTATLTITATAIEDSSGTSSIPVICAMAPQNNVDGRTTVAGETTTGSVDVASSASATITYTGVNVSSADVASFNVKYPAADLMYGTYTSYITMTYTTQS